MSIALNEVKWAESVLERGEVGNKPTSTLFLLGKYYRQKKGLNKTDTIHELNKFMEKNYKNYNHALWEESIEDIAKKAIKYPLREIDFIGITKKELDTIGLIKNIKFQKLLFTMLCYAKLYNTISPTNNGWINADIQEIYNVARVTVKHRADKYLFLNDLEKTNLISFSSKNDNLNIKVNFVDQDIDYVLLISDYRELGYEYLNYIGHGCFTRCQHCNRLIRKKSKKDFSTKYCNDCAKHVKNEQNKRYYREKNKI